MMAGSIAPQGPDTLAQDQPHRLESPLRRTAGPYIGSHQSLERGVYGRNHGRQIGSVDGIVRNVRRNNIGSDTG
ncbi:hypothetical protein MicloDRAFT_00034500 [Microvirga lotononidis]|uniref:Uncharacterized protein n=1 Tax=Microvirga lotononidis TaxID=864069 RepID=I4YSF7_9HYPH|nr:hypothetical protein MicloDRAFT_00034500 [Microvirga lotononidis]